MKLIFYVAIICFSIPDDSVCNAFFSPDRINVAKVVQFINSVPDLKWKAGSNGFPNILKLSDVKSKLGWIPTKKKNENLGFMSLSSQTEADNLPKNYDSRTAYPNCTTISSIKNQGKCGSCWAVSIASTFSDRLCIHSNGAVNFNMSANQLLACDKKSKGCKGGYLNTAWNYTKNEGLVTGGDYGSKEGCQPYSIKPDNSGPDAETPKCHVEPCPNKYKATSVKEPTSEYEIRKEIYKNGPITTGFAVYLSFMFYKKGIYSRLLIDIPTGGHGVRVIGWGEEKGEKYWLVANSWGRGWGENGLFRMRRVDGPNIFGFQEDNCGFEENMIAGVPVL